MTVLLVSLCCLVLRMLVWRLFVMVPSYLPLPSASPTLSLWICRFHWLASLSAVEYYGKGNQKPKIANIQITYKYTVTFSFPNVGRLNRIPPRCNLDSVRPLPVPHKNNKGNHETFHFSIKYKNNLMQLSFTSIAVEIFFEVRSFLQNIS